MNAPRTPRHSRRSWIFALAAALAACSGPAPIGLEPGAPSRAPAPPSPELRVALEQAGSERLGALRGGDGERWLQLSASERAELAAAQQESTGLAEQRAGDLSNRELTIIGITLAVVILLILLL